MGPAERRGGAGQVQVVTDQHQLADMKSLVNRAGRVGQHQPSHAQAVHDPHLGGDLAAVSPSYRWLRPCAISSGIPPDASTKRLHG